MVAAALFATAAVIGTTVFGKETLRLGWPPLFAHWVPHLGPGTPAAVCVAVLVVCYGPGLASRLAWRWLLASAALASLAWTTSLALVDGWRRGFADRLAIGQEYLTALDDIGDVGVFLRTFTERIPIDSAGNWPAHVAGHPPGATLTFVLLDRVGLAGGAWAAAFCVLAGASATAAVLVTLRAVVGEDVARRAAPFVVLAPAAVWLGVSADGYFAAVAAWAVALLALAATGSVRWPRATAVGSGVLFGWLLFLSYGLVLMAPVAAAVLVLCRAWRPVPYALAGIVPWVVGFAAAGFWWFDGYVTLVERYYAGVAGIRPYGYFVWGNPAAQVLSVGPAVAAGLACLVAAGRRGGRLAVLVGAGVLAMLAADLSGMSKAETERIWLPFALWLLPAAVVLPGGGDRSRWWLAAQAATALAVNHLWLTRW
ncbi:hypothetical protein [Streptomyces sp. 8K308]|uniref:hypothetical protein n=1 Tax=Streptomyces sp. 8K308 TaxID=2530388 RepID=UPI001FB574B2|nr:hypothetical protein [Streptomyces sp. 8K308]